jgi:hypothetical protein
MNTHPNKTHAYTVCTNGKIEPVLCQTRKITHETSESDQSLVFLQYHGCVSTQTGLGTMWFAPTKPFLHIPDRGNSICTLCIGKLAMRSPNMFHRLLYIRHEYRRISVQPKFNLLRLSRSRIHESTMSLRFLGIILRVLRLEVSVYNVYITNQFQTTFSQGGE